MRRSTGRSPWSRKTRRTPPEGTPVNERRAGSYPRAPSLAPLGQFTLSRPTDGAPAAQASGNPSSAPVRALGHLPPQRGEGSGHAMRAPTEWAVTRRLRGAPRPFGGKAPTAARRARPVQRSGCQGLPGDRRGPPKARQRLYETKKGTGRGCTPGSCFVCTAFRRHEPPYWGVQGGRSPPALLSPPFLREEMGAPAAQASAGRLGLHQTGGYYPPLRAWQLAYRAGQARPQGTRPFQTKKRAARDTGGACVYRSSRKYAKPRLAGGCLSRLLRREVKISTTTVTT